MKGFFLALAVSVLAATGVAQVVPEPAPATAASETPSAKAQNSDAVQAGTILSVELSKSLDTKKLKAADKIEARTAIDLLQHGQIVVPRNTRIVGHVTEAKAHSKSSPGAIVGITFDRMLFKDGREVPLNLSVQAIGRPLSTWNSSTGYSAADNPAGSPMAMPGQRSATGAIPSGGAGSQYPGASDTMGPDPRDPNSSTATPLNTTSHGVIGIKGLSMDTSGPASKLSSATGNVHLDGGTQLILRVM